MSSGDSLKFEVSSKLAEQLPRCEGSKSCLLHYFGQPLIQQPVLPYRHDKTRPADVARNLSFIVNSKGVFEVTGSHVHFRGGSITQMVLGRDVVTTGH